MKKLCVLASGSGSNFEAIQKAIVSKKINASIECVISDKEHAFVHVRAAEAKLPSYAVNPKKYESKDQYELEILNLLNQYNPDLIICAGYMRILGKVILEAYEGKILNIHPSKLPQYKGLDALGQALRNHETEIGVTVHWVDASLDGGPIVGQRVFSVSKSETREEIEERLHKIEHELYVDVLNDLCKEGGTK